MISHSLKDARAALTLGCWLFLLFALLLTRTPESEKTDMKNAQISLTPLEAEAVLQGLGNTLEAGDEDDQIAVYGDRKTHKAACRAYDKIRLAKNKATSGRK